MGTDSSEHNRARRRKRNTNRKAESILVPAQLLQELEAAYPTAATTKGRQRTKHQTIHAIVIHTAVRCLRSRGRMVSHHAALSRHLYTQRTADEASRFLRRLTKCFDVAQEPAKGRNATMYRLRKELVATAKQSAVRRVNSVSAQHIIWLPGSGSDGPDFPPNSAPASDYEIKVISGFSAAGEPDLYPRQRWCFCGDLVPFHFPEGWFDDYANRYHEAAIATWGDKFLDHHHMLQASFEALEIPLVDLELCLANCGIEDQSSREAQDTAKAWLYSWESFSEGVTWSYRQQGRLYYGLANIPKVLRRRLSFGGDGWCEIDMRSTYWVCLASLAGVNTAGSQRLLLDIAGGSYYSDINAELDQPYPAVEVKKAVNRDGLFGCEFGDGSFGKTSIFKVLRDRYPEPMRYVLRYRNCENGASLLSHELTRLEAKVFIDRAFRQCHDKGIRVLPVHDCLACSPVDQDRVFEILRQAASDVLGCEPGFSREVHSDNVAIAAEPVAECQRVGIDGPVTAAVRE